MHVRVQPSRADLQVNLAHALQQAGDLHHAVLAYQRAIALDPCCFSAYNNLGTLFASLEDWDVAAIFLNAALKLKPDLAEVHNNLGNVSLKQKKFAAAIESYRKALVLEPGSAVYHNHLGNTLGRHGDLPEAERFLGKALCLDPSYAAAAVNLGLVLAEQGKPEAAEAYYRRAIALEPELALAHVNLSQLLLRRGDLIAGWAEAEWRWKWKSFPSPPRSFSRPQWRGEPLNGETILLHAEQGFGDTLQMLRYVPLLARRGARIVLEIHPELKSLARNLEGVTQLLARGEPLPAFDWHCPLMSLPLAFGSTLENLPSQTPYLSLRSPERPSWLAPPRPGDLQVGLVWAGSPKNTIDRRRSLALAELAPLSALKDVSFYSLQRGGSPSDHPSNVLPFVGMLPESVDFAGTAAALTHLDLIVTVDTAVAHLAGALGQPVCILLPHLADWRWLLDREDSPWYPSATLFRQGSPGDWSEVVTRVAAHLASAVAARRD